MARASGNADEIAGDAHRVGFAALPARAARRPSQLRRHPHQLFALREQPPLEPARHVPTILDCPQPLTIKPRPPRQQQLVRIRDRQLIEQRARLVDSSRFGTNRQSGVESAAADPSL